MLLCYLHFADLAVLHPGHARTDVITVHPSGWEVFEVLICPECRRQLYLPGARDFALELLTSGGCGHPEPGGA
jgi:hypothetical protein